MVHAASLFMLLVVHYAQAKRALSCLVNNFSVSVAPPAHPPTPQITQGKHPQPQPVLKKQNRICTFEPSEAFTAYNQVLTSVSVFFTNS